MKQLLQSISKRKSFVAEVPAPALRKGEVLVRVMASLISAGTEKTSVEFAEKNLLQKARSRPDLFRQVINTAKREGILSTWEKVRGRLDSDLALGYSNAGIVLAVGGGVDEIKPGEAVACGGGGYALHAEIVRVPRNLVARIPGREPEVPFEEACFTTVAAIAMQGFRLAETQIGETVVVIGLGLLGLLVLQTAKAAGCAVIGMDPNSQRCRLAESLGCEVAVSTTEHLVRAVMSRTQSRGADAVLITAATASNGPIAIAGTISRSHGHVIVVGAVGLQVPRQPFYDKELTFRISCSYGPGRYDSEYEEKGNDYPFGFVRWTENRNMQAALKLISEGKLNVRNLISHRLDIVDATRGYDLVSGKIHEPYLGIVIRYSDQPSPRRVTAFTTANPACSEHSNVRAGVIGVGNFATGILIPAMKKVTNVELVGVCAETGATAHGAGSRLGFRYCTTDADEILRDESINTVVIVTRHDSHASLVCSAIARHKNVFCEKPLCVTEFELSQIVAGAQSTNTGVSPTLMVGFNRRFAAMATELKRFVNEFHEPLMIHYRVNAGYIPANHWTQSPEQGRRIIGEVCHFVDFCSYLTGQPVESVQASRLPNSGQYCDDNVTTTLSYADGSIATITYVANGNKNCSKERVEVFGAGKMAVLDDFRVLTMVSGNRRKTLRSRFRQDKGHIREWQAFASALRAGGPPPISFEEIVNTTLATFKIVQATSSGTTETVDTRLFLEKVTSGNN